MDLHCVLCVDARDGAQGDQGRLIIRIELLVSQHRVVGVKVTDLQVEEERTFVAPDVGIITVIAKALVSSLYHLV